MALGSLKGRNRLWKVVAASIGKIMVGGGSMASVVGVCGKSLGWLVGLCQTQLYSWIWSNS